MLTITLILRIVPFNHHNNILIICGISDIQVETYAAHIQESSLGTNMLEH